MSPGGVPEWLKGPVSKTGVPLRGTVGSNPTSSASATINSSMTGSETVASGPGFLPTPSGIRNKTSDLLVGCVKRTKLIPDLCLVRFTAYKKAKRLTG